ncbi:MAG: UDP-glucose 6-dehydrogenase [Candidatus Margulisbacteria bacterium GWF2_38_17]|nr:MAG: UDP-glucose 6-dehydrogenase [Candidatus Margulisbacteria bacterium GWF2_38_17]
MKIAVVGTGYVGLVTGTCLADLGNEVVCVDKDDEKINMLNSGKIPIYEPGLEELVKKNVIFKRLSFSNNLVDLVSATDIFYIAVGTPPTPTGEADISAVLAVAKTIGETLKKQGLNEEKFKVIVNKSTVPVGMGVRVEQTLNEMGIDSKYFGVVSNPEFLREGSAINDTMRPNRIVIGSNSTKALDIIEKLYRPIYLIEAPVVKTNLETAEMIKYASNCFLATKISFINEMANICEKVGADVNTVAKGMGLDNRIGKYFLHAGPGYGGSCFPKDTRALISIAAKNGYDLKIVKAAEEVNAIQKRKVGSIVKEYFENDTNNKVITLLGLAFKPNTDDMREAPALIAIEELLAMGFIINVFDPASMDECQRKYLGNRVVYCNSVSEAVEASDGVIIMTEWNEFREMDMLGIKKKLRTPFFLDARNIYVPERMREIGFHYYCIGRC